MKEAASSEISRNDARESLREIDHTMRTTRLDAGRAAAVPLLLLWGAIWFVYPLIMQFWPGGASWAWLLFPLGGIISWPLGARSNRVATGPTDLRIGLCWWILFLFAGVWAFLLRPESYQQMYAFGCTVAMFAYVVGGLWWGRFFIWLGVAITMLTLFGYYRAGSYFWLWMAFMGGGALLLSAAYIHLTWRARGA